MSKFFSSLRGCFVLLLIALNTVIGCLLMAPFVCLKLFIPIKSFRRFFSKILMQLASNWVGVNTFILDHMGKVELDVQGVENLNPEGWYMIISNHQSWTDIPILQRIFHDRIPFLKFFLKQVLIWVPFLGAAWWALDMPFMKRYTKKDIEKNPQLKGKDLQTTIKACEKFKDIPISVINFLEGTRFKPERKKHQKSPYQYLLNPKAGGLALILSAMGTYFTSILNVTIVYPGSQNSLWDLFCGRIPCIIVRVEQISIPQEFLNGDYTNDLSFRMNVQNWLNGLWAKKDKLIDSLLNHSS